MYLRTDGNFEINDSAGKWLPFYYQRLRKIYFKELTDYL